MSNRIRTAVLLAVLTAFILWVGQLLGGRQGLVIALVLAAGMNFFSYWFSHRMVLSMYRAKPVTPSDAPELYAMVESLSQQAQLPMPSVYRIPQDAPNAFATGRNPEHAVIAVTDGLLRSMEREEIRGVLAHEMAHIQNRDMLIGSIAATMAGAVMVLASMARWSAFFGGGTADDEEGALGWFGLIAMSILAPLAAALIQMAISRSREYLADSTGARLAGGSEGLARALEKLGAYSRRIPMNANPSTAHMFIVNPLAGGSIAKLFSTHPPLDERVRRLRGTRPRTGVSNPITAEEAGNTGKRQAEDFWNRLSK
ncbi:MAG: zinc metalloprotease HtpX [Desulfobacteraceae bacterium]|nr:zinc metalloprotease HtpX [Desulfobacteraceae bacterium]